METVSKTTFHDHVSELRKRLMWVALVVIASALVGYMLREPMLDILQKPLDAPLFYSSPAGSFNFIIRLSTMLGVIVALPFGVYHAVKFLEPALPLKISTSRLVKIIASSTVLALLGIAFSYFYMIPISLHFFQSFSSEEIQPLISANEYLSYTMSNFVIFALIFQIPLIILFINWVKPIKPSKLLKYQRHVIVAAMIISLVLPFTYDPLSQFMVAVPIIALYYFSVALVLVANRNKTFTSIPPSSPITAV